MEIGGQDFSFDTVEPVSRDEVMEVIRDLWPEAVFEFGEGDDVEGDELFAYRDDDAQESWNKYGLTDDNGDALLHVIIDGCHIHIVHDNDELADKFVERLS